MTNLFQILNCHLDPWQADYGLGYRASQELEGQICSDENCSIETPLDAWSPISPDSLLEESPIAFVDGVRRIHLRIIQQKQTQFYFGAIGSIAVGASVMKHGEINLFSQSLISSSIRHIVLLGDCSGVEGVVRIPLNFPENSSFDLCCCQITGRDPEEPVNRLQQLMREEEAALIEQLNTSGEILSTLLVADGPLNLQRISTLSAVGYVKTLHTLYVPEKLHPTIWQLQNKQRTPIFLIQPEDWEENKVARFSCYLRIAEPAKRFSPMSGLVRLEISSRMDFDAARNAFDRCAAALPFFASPWGRDPRAPQNLVPLGALEMELRRRIGHPGLIQRILQDQF